VTRWLKRLALTRDRQWDRDGRYIWHARVLRRQQLCPCSHNQWVLPIRFL